MAKSAVGGTGGIDLDGYRDYRGVPVVGVWTGADDLGLGIATEIDISEAYRPLRIARLILLFLTGFSLLLLLGLVLLFVLDQRHQRAAQKKLRQANRELDAFVYTLCHDLRGHLTPVIGYTDFLRTCCRERLDAQVLSCLSAIESSGQKMIALMEDLLDLARAGQVERPAEAVDTREVVNEVVCGLNGQLVQACASVEVGDLPPLHVPNTLLAQIFDNLIGNAVRYGCKPGGAVQVGGERRGTRVRFYVRDHGPGIPPEERSRIFEVFFRGRAGKQVPGSGIGLATVQKIARLYGGRAWMEETPGGGSTFWVEMEDVPTAARNRARHTRRE
jgi:signal transduction histidine kinase